MQVEAVRVPAQRAEKNKQFANDGSFESVDKLLAKVAAKCFARVQAMGLGMTFDDVRQEMNVSYVMAKKLWDSERGILFSTYLTTACYRNFNDRIRKAETVRRHLGLVNMTDMRPVNAESDEDVDMSAYFERRELDTFQCIPNLYGDSEIEGSFSVSGQVAPMDTDPSVYLEEVQECAVAKERARNALTCLTPNAKAIVSDLLMAAKVRQDGERLPSLRSLFESHNLPEREARRIRKELSVAFGAKF